MDPRRLSIEVSEELALIIDARIASGRSVSESEVVREALELLARQDASIEHWLRTEAVEAYDEWRSGKVKGLTVDEVLADLEARRTERDRAHAAE